MGKIADFYAELKIKDGLSMTLKEVWNKMGELRLSTLGEITALGVLGDMLKNAGSQAMVMSAGYTTLNKELGISTNLLQRWQNVARSRTTVAPEEVAGGFAHIQKVLAGLASGDVDQGFMKGAALLGMHVQKGMTYDQVLEILRSKVPESINKYGAAVTTGRLGMMGLDKMEQLFALSPKQFQAGEFSSGVMSQTQIKQWTKLNEQIHVLEYNLIILGEKALAPLLPKLIKLTDNLLKLQAVLDRFIDAAPKNAVAFGPSHVGTLLGNSLAKELRPHLSKLEQTLHNNFKIDVRILGGEKHTITSEFKQAIKNAFQEVMTTAAQTQNSQQAY